MKYANFTVRFKKHVVPKIRIFAMVLILLLASIATVFIPVQAVQEAVVTTVIQWRDNFMKLGFYSDASQAKIIPSTLSVNYIPVEYSNLLLSEHRDGLFVRMYQDEKGKQIHIQVYPIESNSRQELDTEKRDAIIIEFGENRGLLNISDEDVSSLVWESNGFAYSIFAQEPLNEIVKIAENIVF